MLSSNTQSNRNIGGYLPNYFSDLFIKKRKLVKLELDFISQVQAEWQNIIANTATDRKIAETSIKACYRHAGLDLPNIIWADHPINVIKISIDRPDLQDVSGIIINEIWQSELEIQKSIEPESILQVLAGIDPQHEIATPQGVRQMDSIAERLNELVMERVHHLHKYLTERTIPNPLQNYSIGDLGYFDYFQRIGVNIPQIEPAIDLAKSCGWCWTFKKVAILTPKPTKVKFDRQGKIIGIIYNETNILADHQ